MEVPWYTMVGCADLVTGGRRSEEVSVVACVFLSSVFSHLFVSSFFLILLDIVGFFFSFLSVSFVFFFHRRVDLFPLFSRVVSLLEQWTCAYTLNPHHWSNIPTTPDPYEFTRRTCVPPP